MALLREAVRLAFDLGRGATLANAYGKEHPGVETGGTIVAAPGG
jgi:hypothetical protein